MEWWMQKYFRKYQRVPTRASCFDATSRGKTLDYVSNYFGKFNGVCVGAAWRVWPKIACYLLPEQKVYRLWNKIFTARENLMRSGMGCSLAKTVYVDLYYLIDIQDGSNKIHIREACPLWENSEMADDPDWIWNSVHYPKSNKGQCTSRSPGSSSCGWLLVHEIRIPRWRHHDGKQLWRTQNIWRT